MNYVKISYFNDLGEEILANLPAKLEACSLCLEQNNIDNLNFLLSKNNRSCSKCNGTGVQKVIDESAFSSNDLDHYHKYINEINLHDFSDLEWVKEFKQESMMGRW